MITLVEGMLGVGDGKSWYMTNILLYEYLVNSNKHVYTTLPCDGEELEWLLSFFFPGKPVKRDEARSRIHFLYSGQAEAFGEYWERPIIRADYELMRAEAEAGDIPPVDGGMPVEGNESMVWVRCPWPTTAGLRVRYSEMGCRKIKVSLGMKDRLGEFWHFCPAGSVIIIDEAADVFGSGAHADAGVNKERRKIFKAYLRQHRHYVQDLFFACQDRMDLDVEMRRLCQCVIKLRNLKKVPLIEGKWWARGLRWPVQVFEARHFLATQVTNKSNEQVLVIQSLEAFKYWPKSRSFKNYRSFSEASALPGKAPAEEGMHSADMDTPWDRIKGVLNGLGLTLGVFAGACVGVYCFVLFLFALCGVQQNSISRYLYGNKFHAVNSTVPIYAKNSHSTNGVVIPLGLPVSAIAVTNGGPGSVSIVRTNDLPVLRLVLVTPERLGLSNGLSVRSGGLLPGCGVVIAWGSSGVWCHNIVNGLPEFFEFNVLLSSQGLSGVTSGRVDERILQSIDTVRRIGQ